MEATRSLYEAAVARMGLHVGTLARAVWTCLVPWRHERCAPRHHFRWQSSALIKARPYSVIMQCHICRLEAAVGHARSVSSASRRPGRLGVAMTGRQVGSSCHLC